MSAKNASENPLKQRRAWNLNRKVYGRSIKTLAALVILVITIGSVADIAYSSWTQTHNGNIPPIGIPISALNFVLCPVLNVNNALMGELTVNSQCPQASTVSTQIGFQPLQSTDPTASWSLTGNGLSINLVFLSVQPCPTTMPTGPVTDQISSTASLLSPALTGGSGAPTYLYCIYYTSGGAISSGTFTINYAASNP